MCTHSLCYSGNVAPATVSAVLHPDDLFVIGTRTGELIVWNTRMRTLDRVLSGHTGPVGALLLLEDGRIASGSNDGDLRIWDLSMSKSTVLHGHRAWISQLVVLSGNRIASSDCCGDIKVWDTRTYTCLRTLKAAFGWAQMLVPLSDNRLASSSMDSTVQIWDVETGRKRGNLELADRVYTLLELEDGRLVTGGAGDTISVWDPITFACIKTLHGPPHMGKLYALPGNRLVARGDTLAVWNLSTDLEVPVQFNPEDGICALLLMDNGMLVGGGRDGVVYVWDTSASPIQCIAHLRGGHDFAVCSLEQLQDDTLLSASIDGKVSIWNSDWTQQRPASSRR